MNEFDALEKQKTKNERYNICNLLYSKQFHTTDCRLGSSVSDFSVRPASAATGQLDQLVLGYLSSQEKVLISHSHFISNRKDPEINYRTSAQTPLC